MSDGIDYGQYEQGRYCNYWELDRTIQRELRRVYPGEEFQWARPRLDEFGEMVGAVTTSTTPPH